MSSVVDLMSPLTLFIGTLVFLFFVGKKSILSRKIQSPAPSPSRYNSITFPKSYPLIGSYLDIYKNRNRLAQWSSDLLQISPSGNFILDIPLRSHVILTVNPANVERVLKTRFDIYKKGTAFRSSFRDFLGDGIVNANDETWRFQRQVAVHEFSTKSLRKFVETVVDVEITRRLTPVLAAAAGGGSVLDFQDILQRFAFDNICKIAFGFDPAYLTPALPEARLAGAIDDAVRISMQRFDYFHSRVWKVKRLLQIGSEKQLREAVSEIRGFARSLIEKKKKELETSSSVEPEDLLSRFLDRRSSGPSHSDEFVIDIIINFLLGGLDTTSAALTWFFWLISQNPKAEEEIVKEIGEKYEAPMFEEVKHMVYTHAALCESMRLYPPVPYVMKEAAIDDVWDDGTVVEKGTRVIYHIYAMGRSEKLWGPDWAEYRPERWLKRDVETSPEKWRFAGRDACTYPVFQAGPRVCIGRDMAFLQMKRIVAGVMRRFRVVPVARFDGVDPAYVAHMTSKMEGGFPVFIKERNR